MSTKYAERIRALQAKLKETGTDYYILADADPHGSEYVCDYFKLRSAFSGFTGSNGTLLVGQSSAWLWTDGRYFIQAEKELEDSGILLMRMGEPGVYTLPEFVADCGNDNAIIGCDGKCLSMNLRRDINKAFTRRNKECVFCYDAALAGDILKESQEATASATFTGKPIRVLPEALAGIPVFMKLHMLRMAMKERGCQVFVSTGLDANMWLLNIRGEDIPYCPVAYSYVIVTEDKVFLYVKKEAVTPELEAYAVENNIEPADYDCFYEEIGEHVRGKEVMGDFSSFNAYVIDLIYGAGAYVNDTDGGLKRLQAVKSEIEIQLMKEIYIKDSAAVCKFLYWLSGQKPGTVTEYDAACKMDALRAQIPENRGLSFNTISAYGPNAAMMHYETKKDTCAMIEEGNLFLLDSGGQYDGGTTDVTRTVIIGEPAEEMRTHYTMVVRGMLALQNAVFMKGCTGVNLDILARQPIWEACMDYKCGTGHGIGYMLNVHEGPHGIRTRASVSGKDAPIEPGMLVSDEPGIYLEGKYGIRMENILLCRNYHKNEHGEFLHFEPLTYVPVDMRLIDLKAMTQKEIDWLLHYQNEVYDKIAPLLTKEESMWLRRETMPLI